MRSQNVGGLAALQTIRRGAAFSPILIASITVGAGAKY
jgi:hypothetical protein